MTKFLSSKALCEALGISQTTLYRLRKSGMGPPYIKLASKVLYRAADIKNWAASQAADSNHTPRMHHANDVDGRSP